MSNSKLPRGPNAAPLGPDETVRKSTGADLQNGWLARHGTLSLTDDRLVFVPTVLDRALQAKRREIVLDRISDIERFPLSPGGVPHGGKRPRMLLHTPDCVYELMVGDLDAWIDALRRVYQLRARAGRPHRPVVRREGYANTLYEDDD